MIKVTQSNVIYDELIKMVKSGNYDIGSKLPTEMELCKKYSVSRPTIREAIRMLQARNIVEVRRGSGTYVISTETGNEVSKLTIDNLEDFMQIRISIETLAIKLFINEYSDKKFDSLQLIEKKFEEAVVEKNIEMMSKYDELFHQEIIVGTNNSLLINIGELLSNSFRIYRNKTFTGDCGRDAIIAHQKILDALKLRNTDDAVMKMYLHLDSSYKSAKKRNSI